jgi:uncharacterized membrane protein YkoI
LTERVQRLKNELRKVAATQQDPNLSDGQRNELRAIEAKLRHALQGLDPGRRGVVYSKSGDGTIDVEIEVPEQDDYEFDPLPGGDADSLRYRRAMEKLKRDACISMEEAMELALASYPGEVIEKSMGSINGEVVYRFFIRDAAATADRNALMVDVNGIHSRIIRAARANVSVRTVKNRNPE